MSDPTNDIDALLMYLCAAAEDPYSEFPYGNTAAGFYAALTELVAERDELRKRVAEQDADIKSLSASNAILHGRLETHPTADRELAAMQQQRDEAVEQYTDLLRRLSGSVSSSPPRAAFLTGDASQKEGGGA